MLRDLTNNDLEMIANEFAKDIPWCQGNIEIAKQYIELFDKGITPECHSLNTSEDYINLYWDHFYSFETWEDLINSEMDIFEEGYEFVSNLCSKEIGDSIWQLPCGIYVQYNQ